MNKSVLLIPNMFSYMLGDLRNGLHYEYGVVLDTENPVHLLWAAGSHGQ